MSNKKLLYRISPKTDGVMKQSCQEKNMDKYLLIHCATLIVTTIGMKEEPNTKTEDLFIYLFDLI